MHANNFFSEFLNILKNDFLPVGASTPRSQSGFPKAEAFPYEYVCLALHNLFPMMD
jgi:hypothetical protein